VNDRAVEDGQADGEAAVRWSRKPTLVSLNAAGLKIVMRGNVDLCPIVPEHDPTQTAAELHGPTGDGVEHRLRVSLRLGDSSQDLTRRCLLLERLREALLEVLNLDTLVRPRLARRWGLSRAHGFRGPSASTQWPLLAFHGDWGNRPPVESDFRSNRRIAASKSPRRSRTVQGP
jgi:hypothetical protein